MIARKTWREIRLMTLGYTLLLQILILPEIVLYPELRMNADTLSKMMPIKMFKDMIRSIGDSDAGFLNYVATQLFFKNTNIVGIAAAVLLATALVARERENRTLEFLLARPIPRTRILLAKFGVVAAALVVPIFLTTWSAILLADFIEESLPFAELTLCAMHASSFVLLFAALTTLLSVVLSTQAMTAFAIGVFIVLQASTYFIQVIRSASLFRLADWGVYGPVMVGNMPFTTLFFGRTVWLLLATAAVLAVAVALFRRTEP